MTYSKAIELVDERTANGYTTDDKVRWLMQLDQKIYDELIATHEQPRPCHRPEDCSPEDALLVREPYAEDIYINFLQARIAKENEETAKYNVAITLYNAAYADFAKLYNRQYRPRSQRNHFRF